MRRIQRKTTPRVVNGRVQRKNRHAPTANYYNTPQEIPVIDRERPGPGHRHILRKRDIIDFISILPEWAELSEGLNAILLATADDDTAGWHTPGIVAVCAWPRALWMDCDAEFYEDHRDILERLGVPTRRSKGGMLCQFTESTVRAYQLLHILLHELGHHHDRMTTRSRNRASRGEGYAERYAHEHEKTIWERYLDTFGLG
jgi:hypothetical protein